MKSTLTKLKPYFTMLVVVGVLMSALRGHAATRTASVNGAWNVTGTWGGSAAPVAGDDVIINTGITVSGMGGSAQACATITINGTGVLTVDNGLAVSGAITLNGTSRMTHSATTGTRTYSGDVTINSGCTFNETAAAAITFGGRLINKGIFIASTGVHTFTGTASISGSLSNSIPSVTFNGTTTVNGYVNASSAVAGSGTVTMGSGGTLVAPTGANIVATLSGMSASDSTVIYRNNGGTIVSGTYYNLGLNTSGGNSSLSSISTINGELNVTASSIINPAPSTLTLGKGLVWNASGTAGSYSTAITMGGNSYYGGQGSVLLTLSGVINDGGSGYSFTKIGSSSLTLAPATPETYTGNTIVNGGGLLTLDYANATTPANGIIKGTTASPLVFGSGALNPLGGGALVMYGKSGISGSQTFNGLTLTGGGNVISNFVNGATASVIALGAISSRSSYGGTVDFGNSAAGGSITTSSGNNAAGILGGYATYGASDWATVSSGTIVALSSYTTLPTSGGSSTVNYSSAGTTLAGALTGNSLKLTGGTLALGNNNLTLGSGNNGGLLVSANASISSSGSGTISAGSGNELVIFVKPGVTLDITPNTAGMLLGTGSGGMTVSGGGTVNIHNGIGAAFSYTGPTVVKRNTTFKITNGNTVSGNLVIEAGATVDPAFAGMTFNGSLSGSGSLCVANNNTVVTFGANSSIYPGGTNAFGNLTINDPPSFTSGTKIIMDLSKNPNNTNFNDTITFTYSSAAPAWNSVAPNITINQVDGVLGVGQYVLLQQTSGSQSIGTTTTPTLTFTGGNAPSVYRTYYTSGNANKLILEVSEACAAPTAQTVTGTGSFCSSSGATLGLANSADSSVTYQLFRDGVAVGSGVTGTSAALTPGAWASLTTVGTYTIWATNTCGSSAQMTGSAVVTPSVTTSFNVTGGDSCSSVGSTIGLSGSQSGVTYILLRGGTVVSGVASVAGTGSAISFSPAQTTAGTYTVQGTNAGCGAVNINGGSPTQVVITQSPNAPTIGTATPGDSSVTVTWTAPGSGPTPTGYNVKRGTASGGPYGVTVAANLNATSFTDDATSNPGNPPVNGTAYYYVVSSLNGGCESAANSAQVAATPNASFSGFTIQGAGSVTAGTGSTILITAVNSDGSTNTAITGSIPLTFSGLSAAPDSSAATVNGTANGSQVSVSFTAGQGTASLVAHKVESATLHVTDGAHNSGFGGSPSAGGQGLALTVATGADSAYRLTGTGSPQVGVNYTVNVALVDQYQNPSSTTDTRNLTFNGTMPAGTDGSVSTVNGVAQGTAASVSFTSGTASVTLVAHKAGAGGTLSATDTGSLTTSTAGGTTLALGTITAGADSAYRITAVSTNPAAGASDQLTVTIVDQYRNLSTYSGTKALVFAGLSTIGANTPTVTDNTAAAKNLGQETVLTFASGTSSVGGSLVAYKAESATLTVTDTNSLSTSGTGGASLALSPVAGAVSQVAWTTQPSSNSVYGSVLTTQPALETRDAYGNFSRSSLPASLPVTISSSVELFGTTNYDIGTATSNGIVTCSGIGFKGGVGGTPALVATILQGYGSPQSGMNIWLDASDSSTIIGSPVTQWNDKSGNGFNFTLFGGSGNPTYVTTVQPGRKALTFPGTRGMANSSYANTTANISVFIVYKGTGSRCLSTYTAGQPDYFTTGSFEMDPTSGGFPRTYRGNFNLGTLAYNSSTNYHAEEWFTAGGTDSYKISDATQIGRNAGTHSTAGNYNISKIAIATGLDNGGVQNFGYTTGDICEVLVYNSDQSANRTAIETYLKNKWMVSTFGNYSNTFGTLTATSSGVSVSAKTLTVSGLTGANNKVYDTTDAATLAGTAALQATEAFGAGSSADGKPYTGDTVSLSGTPTATFAGVTVNNNIAVTVSGYTLSGAQSGNYTITQPSGFTANITAAPVTITSGVTADNKVYDASTAATLSVGTVVLSGVYGADSSDVSLVTNGYTATFASTGPANGVTVTVNGLSLTGAKAGNYSLSQPTGLTANITPSSVDVQVLSSLNPSGFRDSVQFTATNSSAGVTPTGNIQFKINGTPFGSTVTVNGSGLALSATTTNLARGTNTITAEFTGSGSFTGVLGTNTLDQVVTNHPPVTGSAIFTRANNTTLKIRISDLLATVTDADTDALTLESIDLVSTNGANITTNGTFIFYTNSVDTNVNDQLSYVVNDGNGGSASGIITISVVGGQVGQTNPVVVLSNDVATVTFYGVPGTAYQAQRATNVDFTGMVRTWDTNAPAGPPIGVFQIEDDFNDLGGPPAPPASYYRLLVP